MQEQKNKQQQLPEEQDIKPCLTCGLIPDINNDDYFTTDQSGKWGQITCCGGPEVRTNYKPVSDWKQNAIDAWNDQWGHKRIAELEQEIEQLRARCS